MPLHLNLTHEIRSQERQRSRDPLRVGLYVIVGIVVLCAGYYFLRQHQAGATVAEADQLTSEWATLEPKQAAAVAEQERLQDEIRQRDHLLHKIEHRFYWAPVLAKMMESVTPDVQLTRFDGSAPSVKDGPRSCTVSITGVAAGVEPRATAEALRQRLREKFAANFQEVTSTFKTLEDSPESVFLQGRQQATASFAIQVTFKSGLTTDSTHTTAAK